MSKKTLSLVLVLSLMFTLVACTGNNEDINSTKTDTMAQSENSATSAADESEIEDEGTAIIQNSESDATSTAANSGSANSAKKNSSNSITATGKSSKSTESSKTTGSKSIVTNKPDTPDTPSKTSDSEESSGPSSPAHIHSYSAATCTMPATCSCGATKGSALGHKWKSATCKNPKTCSVCHITEGGLAKHTYVNGVCSVCGKADPSIPVYTDVLIISNTRTISNQTINKDVYITSVGNATFENVTVTGNIYCYGKLTVKGGTAKDLYAYYWDLGGIKSSCPAWDGTHGLIKGAFKSCRNVVIKDYSLDYAFNKWGKK